MAKKERVYLDPAPEASQKIVDEPIFEAEAYGSPQPDAGSDVTVMKTVGVGGPVPIVAPKHNTIQLQPIVVPLAVVPYMSQDSAVLRTEGKPAASQLQGGYEEATEFKSVPGEKAEKKKRKAPVVRILALVSLLFAIVVTLPFILSYFKDSIGPLKFGEFNAIGTIEGWVHGEKFSWTPISNLLNIIIMAVIFINTLATLIGFIAGKYPSPISSILLLIAFGCLLADLIIDLVAKDFVVADRILFVATLAVTGVALLLSIVFAVIINKREDETERQKDLGI